MCPRRIGEWWADILDPLIFNQAGEYRTDGIFRSLSSVFLQLNMFLHSGWVYGTPIFFAGITGIFLTQPTAPDYYGFIHHHRFGAAALGVALFAHILVFVFSFQFFFVPAGESIRPMGWAVFMFIIGFFTYIIVIPLGIIAIVKERPRFLGVIGLILGVTPFFFSSMILDFASKMKGFVLSD